MFRSQSPSDSASLVMSLHFFFGGREEEVSDYDGCGENWWVFSYRLSADSSVCKTPFTVDLIDNLVLPVYEPIGYSDIQTIFGHLNFVSLVAIFIFFPVSTHYWYCSSPVMYRCESSTIKKAEYGRIDAFELWCWRRLLRVSWTARRSNQSILKEISPEYSLEGLMLKLQHFGHLMWRTDSLEKILMLGKVEGRRRRGQQRTRWMASPTQRTWLWGSSRRQWRTGKPDMLQSLGLKRVRHNWATEQQTRCKLLYLECISNKLLLYSTRNYFQSPRI